MQAHPHPPKHVVDMEAVYQLHATREDRHGPHNPALDLPGVRSAQDAAPHALVRHLAHALLHGAAVVLPHVSAGRWTVAHGQPAMPYVVLDARGEVIAPMPDAFDAALYLAQRHTADAWRWLEARGIAPHTEPSQEALEAVEAAAHTGSLAALVQATCAHFDVHPTVMLAGRHVPAHLAVNMDGVGVVWFGRALISRARASGAWIIYHNTQRTEHDPAEMARELCNLCLRLEHKP